MGSNQEGISTRSAVLLGFVAGAALGALVVALTTPKSGPEVRADLRRLGRRAKARLDEMGGEASEAWAETRERTSQACADIKRGFQDAAEDLRG